VLVLPRRQQAAELDLEQGWLLSIHGISASEPLAGDWIQSGSEQQLHLLSADLAPRGETDPGRAAAVPVTRRLALGAVVVGQGAVAPAGRIHGGDLAGQVLITRPRRQLLHPDRHHFSSHLPEARDTRLRGHPGG
jgi:hypothetical protein